MKKNNLMRNVLTCAVLVVFAFMAMGSELNLGGFAFTDNHIEKRNELVKDCGLSDDEADNVIDLVEDDKMTYDDAIDAVKSARAIKGYWYDSDGGFVFNLKPEMERNAREFKVQKDGTIRSEMRKDLDMIIRIIDQDHIVIWFTGKNAENPDQEQTLTRGEKPYWMN